MLEGTLDSEACVRTFEASANLPTKIRLAEVLYCSDQCGASRITRGSSAPYSEICHTSQQAAPHSKIVSQGFKIAKIAKNVLKF